MPHHRTLFATALLPAVHLLGSQNPATAQVVLSEVQAEAGWIELHNRGEAAADLTGFALYLATDTPNRHRNYWWGFPPGTALAPGGFLRVHWLAPLPANPAPGELHTGETTYHFLFGPGAEPLPAARGALALLDSQQQALMNSPAVFRDWVGWGASGLRREDLAVQQGLWLPGHAAPSIPAGSSLARGPVAHLPAAPEQAWFVDTTPTPLAHNTGSAALATHGSPCALPGHHLLGAPTLEPRSLPVAGNGDFALHVTHTTGLLLETCALVFALDESPPGAPGLLPTVPGGPDCRQWIDPVAVFGSRWLPTTANGTTIPFGLRHVPAALAGVRFHVQAMVFDFWPNAWPPYQGVTNALAVTLGS